MIRRAGSLEMEYCLPVAPGRDEPVLAKQRKMLRDCGFSRLQEFGELTH